MLMHHIPDGYDVLLMSQAAEPLPAIVMRAADELCGACGNIQYWCRTLARQDVLMCRSAIMSGAGSRSPSN